MAAPEAVEREGPEAERLSEAIEDADADHIAEELRDEAEAADEAAAEPADLRPFYDAAATGGATVTVRAGWLTADGEVHRLAINATVGVGQAAAQTEVAYRWYVAQLQAIYGAEGNADQD